MKGKGGGRAGAVLKSEISEFAKTGNTYIVLVVVILFVFLFFAVIMPTAIDNANISRTAITEEYREGQRNLYQSKIESLEKRKQGGEGQLAYIESDRIAHEKYIFFIESNTIEEDYFKLDNIYANYKEERGAVNMMFAADTSCVLLMLLAILLSLAVIFKGIKGTREKYEAAGIPARDVLIGKIWLCEIVIAVSFIILLAVGLLLGGGTGASALIYSFGWRTISPALAYAARMTGAAILTQLAFFGALASQKLMKSKVFGVIAPVVIYAFFLSLSAMLIGFPLAGQAALKFIPLLSLEFAVTWVGSLSFIISAVLHLAAAGALAVYVLWKKKLPAAEYTN